MASYESQRPTLERRTATTMTASVNTIGMTNAPNSGMTSVTSTSTVAKLIDPFPSRTWRLTL